MHCDAFDYAPGPRPVFPRLPLNYAHTAHSGAHLHISGAGTPADPYIARYPKENVLMTELEDARADVKKWQKKVAKHRRAGNDAHEKMARAGSFLRDAESLVRRLEVPAEPRAGAVIRFVKRFAGRVTIYEYVATRGRGGGGWYCTGFGAPQNVTWGSMVDYIRKDNLAPFGFEILTSNASTLSTGQSPF